MSHGYGGRLGVEQVESPGGSVRNYACKGMGCFEIYRQLPVGSRQAFLADVDSEYVGNFRENHRFFPQAVTFLDRVKNEDPDAGIKQEAGRIKSGLYGAVAAARQGYEESAVEPLPEGFGLDLTRMPRTGSKGFVEDPEGHSLVTTYEAGRK